MGKLFLLLVGLVVLELTVMIEVGSVIGALPTVGLLILTAILGSSLVRSEGLKTLFSAQQKMQQGEMPGREVMGGMMLALAGLLLIIPGFVTDFFGILLLQPWLRNKLADKLIGSNQFRMQMGGFHQGAQSPFGPSSSDDHLGQPKQGGTTIEGEFERKE
ncbi:FxsA family protein [Aeromonas sp. MdU4]|uniref:FxsA family protein n=1 Tax=Aeromonas sp. MdU4 TaxID=3342819 RepID=UPI0035B85AF3